jgi:hypothetical protein
MIRALLFLTLLTGCDDRTGRCINARCANICGLAAQTHQPDQANACQRCRDVCAVVS